MKLKMLPGLLILYLSCFMFTCSDNKPDSVSEVTIIISVTDVITVNGDTVAIDSLKAKLHSLGATDKTNIRVVPDPEAGAATIQRVQQLAGEYKQSHNGS